MASGLFRVTAALCRTMIISNTGGALSVLIMFVLGGFILPRGLESLAFYALLLKFYVRTIE